MNIILALDSAMGMFNNVPARVNYSELDLELPCQPQYFEFPTYLDMSTTGLFPKPRLKSIEAFRKLFLPFDQLRSPFEDEEMCCWDMLYLIHSMSPSV